MKVSTLSALLLVLVCCVMLAELVTAGEDDLDNIKNRKDIKKYINDADDKVAAAKEVYNKMIAMGKTKLAERFQKRAKAYFRKQKQQRKGKGKKKGKGKRQ